MPQKLLFGTSNPAKLEVMRSRLAPLGLEIIGLAEAFEAQGQHNDVEIDESGKNPLENARIKAQAYHKLFDMPVFSCDSGLFIEGLTDAEQPGVHVRNVNGCHLNDEEMLCHYGKIAKQLGGRATARYKNAICFILNKNTVYEHDGDDISGEKFYIVEKPHFKTRAGFPIDSLSVHIESGEYYNDINLELAESMDKAFCSFFKRALKL